jgi:hypothetical protein
MASLKRRILCLLIIIDALLAVGLLAFIHDVASVLSEWVILNALVIIPSIAIKNALWRRHTKKKNKSKAQKNLQVHTGQSFAHSKEEKKAGYPFPRTTQNGEIVKSGGEKMIADYFYHHNIRYVYEKPAMSAASSSFSNRQQRRKISRPDFYLLDFDVYVEYWGMVNTDHVDTRQEYIKGMEWKMAKYHENGIKFISVYPEDLGNLDLQFRKRFREITGTEL